MAVADIGVSETLVRKERSLFEEAWIRLIRNKVAVISGIFIIILLLVAIFADFLAPYDYAEQDLLLTNAIPEWMLPLRMEIISSMPPITGGVQQADPSTRRIIHAEQGTQLLPM